MAKRRITSAPPVKPTDPVSRYALAVGAGKILAGRAVRLACARHLKDYARQRTRDFPYYFSSKAAKHILDFFPTFIRLEDGATPMVLAGWQIFCLGSLFGWRRVVDDGRRFQMGYIETAKGSGKSPMLAAVGIYGLAFDGEHSAEIYVGAFDRGQAANLFNHAVRMATTSPELAAMLEIGKYNIAHLESNSFFRAVSSEHRSKSGPIPHFFLLDEIHEHRDGRMLNKGLAGFKNRRQPLGLEITNALALDTAIATPTGWATMGALEVGDSVFNEKGCPCRIVGVSSVMTERTCYRVVFDDGSWIIADAGHLWQTRQKVSGLSRSAVLAGTSRRADGVFLPRGSREPVGVRTTDDIRASVHHKDGLANHSVVLTAPLDLPDAALPVHPYALGCWLGDGNSKDSALLVSTQDHEIIESLIAVGVSVGAPRSVGRKNDPATNLHLYGLGVTGSGRRDSLHSDLRRLGVLNNKHIPQVYLRGSVAQRLDLLQGLMDTDGHISPRSGRCVFTQKVEAFVRQVAELVNSLGMKCTVRHSLSVTRGKSFDRWDVFFYPPWDLPVFRLQRKLKHHRRRHARKRMSQMRHIVDVVQVDSVPVKCIAVDSASRLFAAGRTMVPTHNSGFDKTSICWQHHEHSLQVIDGTVADDQWFAYVCQLDPCVACYAEGYREPKDGCADCDDWTNPAVWSKTNPSLLIGLPRVANLQSQVDSARSMPENQALVKRLHFCIWTQTHRIWIPPDYWEACRVSTVSERNKDQACALGFDMSEKLDLTAGVVALRVDDHEDDSGDTVELAEMVGDQEVKKTLNLHFCVELIPFFWLPADTLHERVTKDRIPCDVWARTPSKDLPYLRVTPGPVVDHDLIYEQVMKEIIPAYRCQRIGYDPHNATQFAVALRDRGKQLVVEVGQGRKLSETIKLFEALVRLKRIRHAGNPVLGWCVANATPTYDRWRNVELKKPQETTKKIDGIIAALIALNQLVLLPPMVRRKHQSAKIWTPNGFISALPPSQEVQP